MMLSQFYAPVTGGQERVVEALSRALVERGHRVVLATTGHPGQPDVEMLDGVVVHRLRGTVQRSAAIFHETNRRHLPPAPDPELAAGLWRLIDSERPDVIHVHDWMAHSLLPVRRRGAPVVMSLHDYGLTCANRRLMRNHRVCSGPGPAKCVSCAAEYYGGAKGVPVAAALGAFLPALSRVVDRFLPVSHAVAVAGRLPERRTRFEVLPNFVPRDVADAAELGPEEHVRPSWLPDGPYVMFAGDATYDKGIDTLLAAHERTTVDVPLLVVGRALSDRLAGAGPSVRVVGQVSHPEVLAAWRGASVAVVPSLWAEPFGMVALEALAFGVPVIASATGGLSDIVEHDVSGVLVSAGDVEGLAVAMDRVAGDPDVRSRMAEAAVRRAAHFDEHTTVSRLEAIYREERGYAAH